MLLDVCFPVPSIFHAVYLNPHKEAYAFADAPQVH